MPRVAIATSLALLAACGDLVGVSSPVGDDGGTGPHADAGDAAAVADVDSGALPISSCRAGFDFGAPSAYSDFAIPSLDHIWLSPDQLTIWASNNGSGATADDLFTSTRPTASVPFPVVGASTLSSTSDDDRPSLSPDLLTLVFARDVGHVAIFVAQRSSAIAPFTSATPVDLHLGAVDTQDPWLTPSGRLYFDSGSTPHLFYADPTGPGTWGNPVAVPGPLTMNGEENPVLSDDELVLYFGAYESASTEKADLWIAQRAMRDAPFGAPQKLTISQAGQDETPTWTTSDGCTLYFSKNPDVFVTKRGP